MLSQIHQNLFIVGDDDQSIYKFRGAKPEFLLKFPKDLNNVKTVILNINYRSTDNIINLANNLIYNNKERYTKNIIGTKKVGAEPILLQTEDIEEEAFKITEEIKKLLKRGLNFKDIAVIFRTNMQARAFVDNFMDNNFPFFMRDEIPNIYDHWLAKDIIAYIKLSLDINKNECLERIINKPKRYISKALIQLAKKKRGPILNTLINMEGTQIWQRNRLEDLDYDLKVIKNLTPTKAFEYIINKIHYDDYIKQYAEFRKVGLKGLFEIVDELKEASKKYKTHEDFLIYIEDFSSEIKNQFKTGKSKSLENAITLSTMHGVKGLEFETVFIISVVEGVIPHEKSISESEIEEERRLFYVAITRAKTLLYISTIASRYENKVVTSQFLKELKFVEKEKTNEAT